VSAEEDRLRQSIRSAPAGVRGYCLVYTKLECRKRLWGITVAPRMPMAAYKMLRSVMIWGLGMKPLPTSPQLGFTTPSSYAKHPEITCRRAKVFQVTCVSAACSSSLPAQQVHSRGR